LPSSPLAQTAGQAQRPRLSPTISGWIALTESVSPSDSSPIPTKLTDAGGQDFPPLLAFIAANDRQRGAQRHRLGGRHAVL
jgi:hypothetical protein